MSSSSPASLPALRIVVLAVGMVTMTAAGLVACGGGSDDNVNSPPAAAVKLDTTNHKAATSTVLDAGFGLADTDLGNFGGSVAGKPGAARNALKAFDALRRARTGALSGTSNDTLACPGGGRMTIATSFAQASTRSTGDRFTITYDRCIELASRSETDGKLEVTLIHVGLGDFLVDPAYEVRLSATFTQLRTVDASGSHVTDGAIDIESVRSAVRQGHDAIAAARLETSETSLNGTRTWNAIHDFTVRNDHTPTTTTSTLGGTVSGSDGLNNGSVTVVTTTPFVRAIGRYPHLGVLTATGDQRSRVEVRALNDTTVRLSLDANGDGVYEQVDDVAWVTLW